MRNSFKGYYKPSKEDFDSLWANAIFVFDTNVLLNLYRYQSTTRDSLLTVIERLADRVWIPHHVGLEFQRNRLKVIAEQHKRYVEVQSIVSKSVSGMQSQLEGLQLKKRHSHINPDKLIENIEKVKSEFLSELSALEEKSISVTSDDEIREKIDSLFDGRVGSPPQEQKEIDDLFKEAEVRYRNAIPPGYEDSGKDDKSSDEFTYGGITYKRKYGDLIVWKQMIKQAENESLKDVIFITDDNKSDWWWKIDSNGKKTIGVRPELSDELTREAGVKRFYVYTTDSFLSYANEYLDAEVTDETIEEVRQLSEAHGQEKITGSTSSLNAFLAEQSVIKWIEGNYSDVSVNDDLDAVAYESGKKYGFDIKLIRDPRSFWSFYKKIIYRHQALLHDADFDEITLVLVALDKRLVDYLKEVIQRRLLDIKGTHNVVIGKVEIGESDGILGEFIPSGEYHGYQLN